MEWAPVDGWTIAGGSAVLLSMLGAVLSPWLKERFPAIFGKKRKGG